MKRYVLPVVCLLLVAAAAWILWSKLTSPVAVVIQGASVGQGFFRGNLVNTGQQSIAHSHVDVVFTDASGKTVGTGAIDRDGLEPGQSAPVQLPAPPTASGFTVSVQGRSGAL